MFTFFSPTLTYADNLNETQFISYKNNNIKISNTSFLNKNLTNQLPYLKNKYQQISGPCWAFANIATLETFLYKKGILKESLSEKHLLSWANQKQNSPGWHINISHGGQNSIANAYFMSGIGPVFEKDCSYNTNNTTFNPILASIKPSYWVKGIKYLNNNVSSIKDAIAKYGAATIIYPITNNLAHAVSAIGWDDNKQSLIVKDSAKYPNNYTFLPYSTTLLQCSCITDAEVMPSDLKIYQYDNFVVNGFCQAAISKKLIIANVFDFNDNEILEKVAIHSTSDNAKIKIFLAPVLPNGKPTNSELFWNELYSGIIPYKGYFTLDLNKKVNLNKNRYAIIVQIEETNLSSKPNIGYQTLCDNLTLPENQNRKSFIFNGSQFSESDLKNIEVFAIKAITKK